MTSPGQLIRARLVILAKAAELKNLARACKLAGVSRSQFYAVKKAYETYGKEGLAPRVRRKPEMPNRTPALLDDHIILKTLKDKTVCSLSLAVNEVGRDQRDPVDDSVRLTARSHQVQEPLTKLSIPEFLSGTV
jgi:hypothetical protein